MSSAEVYPGSHQHARVTQIADDVASQKRRADLRDASDAKFQDRMWSSTQAIGLAFGSAVCGWCGRDSSPTRSAATASSSGRIGSDVEFERSKHRGKPFGRWAVSAVDGGDYSGQGSDGNRNGVVIG